MEIYTIGFTKKTAEQFFESLKKAKIQQLVDIRLNNVSQLAGFSKRDDLEYFLKTICQIDYVHEPRLAPTQELLDEYKKSKGSFEVFQKKFLALMAQRKVEELISKKLFSPRTVLLCSEDTADHCHRSLVVEYLDSKWKNVEGKHL